MKLESRVSGWHSLVGVLGVVTLALGLSLKLEGSSPAPRAGQSGYKAASEVARETTTAKAEALSAGRTTEGVPQGTASRVRAGTIPATGLRVLSTSYVDYRNDEGTRRRQAGTLIGPMPSPGQQGGVAAACTPPDCSFDIECDDGDPCTTDACDIVPGTGTCTGTCSNAAVVDGESGGCDDDVFCNGRETCQSGVCTAGTPAICCSEPANPTICAEVFPRCGADSQNAGVGCQTSADCRNGLCERCQPSCTTNADCADGRRCNGTETCERTCVGGLNTGKYCSVDGDCPSGSCLGQCLPGLDPCGAGARCSEKRCFTGPTPTIPFTECLYDSDCPVGQTCGNITPNPPGILCYLGRCCEPGANPAASLNCTKKTLVQCDAVPAVGGREAMFYAMDGGEQLPNLGCGGWDPAAQLEAWECPKYTSGITQLHAANPPIYPVIIGPISDSAVSVPAPGGPGVALNAIGDDYTLFNALVCVGGTNNGNACTLDSECPGGRCGSFLAMDALRYVGYSISGGVRLSIDFYDAAGNFVEDVVTDTMATELGINVVSFTPPMTIPPSGWIVMHVAGDFEPDMRFAVASTTAAGSAGTNNSNALWINTWPGLPIASVNNNFLTSCDAGPKKNQACVVSGDCPNGTCVAAPAILAFELIGDEVPDPVGGCCKADGECVDGVVSWVCFDQGNIYLGDGQLCAVCNGGTNSGGACRTCSNAPTTFCTGAVGDCPGGTCQPDPDKCRTCVGGTNPGTPCTSDGDCIEGGTCPPLANTCSTGLVGQPCTTNSECDLAGLCDLNTLTCSAGTVGFACTTDPQCNVAGTCVLVACQAVAVCVSGACCNPTTAECTTVVSPGSCNGICPAGTCVGGVGAGQPCAVNADCEFFQGYGTDCDADSGYDGAKQSCCRIPQYSDKRCMGGPNNLQPCTVDTDCRFCVGGSHNGEACTITSAAEPDGCLDEGVCNLDTHQCVGGTPPIPNLCTIDADCPDNSGICRGHCVNRGTGGDSCEDAHIHVITVPSLSESPKTVTISGNNNPATSTEDEPDTCRIGADPGWWESFAIDKCARVRVDMCCSDPVHHPQWNLLVGDCPDQCSTIFGAADPYTAGQAQFQHGYPYCNDYNSWMTFGPLGAGTYWFPIYSVATGPHGDYQVHVTVQGCPTVACCYQACSGGPNVGALCDKNATCPGGTCALGSSHEGQVCTKHADCDPPPTTNCSVTCISACEELNPIDCDARGGYSLAPPNTPAVATCMESTCATGSCCTGPGQCFDQVSEIDQTPMTSAICDEPAFNGNFVGGVRCKGGICVGGPDDGESCYYLADGWCASPGTCEGSSLQLAQANPCPVCVIEGAGNCQRWEDSADFSPSDLGTGSGLKMADDFVPTHNGNLETVCTWGVYVQALIPPVFPPDCGGPEDPAGQRADDFRVRVYEDDGGKPGGGNCNVHTATRCFLNSQCPTGETCVPKALGESTCTRTKAVVPGANTETFGMGYYRMWAYSLTLNTPIPLQAGKTYWLEITNNTGPEFGQNCTWHWSNLLKTSTQGNFYSAAGSETNGYDDGSPRNWDMSWCINLNVAPGGGASQPGGCCTCQGSCSSQLLDACDDAAGTWHEDECVDVTCAPPANDMCQNAPLVPVGLYSVSTQCATTDGFYAGHRAITQIYNDVWYYFKPTTDCRLRADLCSSGSISFFDSAIAIYTNGTNQCPCPADAATALQMEVDASDDDCVILGAATGGVAEVDAVAGQCYTIRAGGFPGNDQGGRTGVDISCGDPVCGDGRMNGAEQCDGLDNVNCRTATPSTFCNPNCTCGAPNPCGNGLLDAGEECDTGTPGVPCISPSSCRQAGDPKQCTCTPYCSNNRIEEGEECDGTDDAACPGRCRSSEAAPVCQCSPPACGNGRLEDAAGEECEFGLCVDGNNNGQPCESDAFCAPGGGTCDETADRLDCLYVACRAKNDPFGGCRCVCMVEPPPYDVVWDPATNPIPWPNVNPLATSRSLRFTVTGLTGPSIPEAIKITMVDLQHPIPPNLPQYPPPDFAAFESATCTSSGEMNGCARWVGKPGTFLENQDTGTGGGTYIAARLQCTPFYHDWKPEGLITVVGAEIAPSSEYSVQTYGALCMGAEDGCTSVSLPVTIYTRRSGDTGPNFNPPATSTQPDALDIVQVVNKLKNLPGALAKAITQLQPNVPELNANVNALDIVAVVDAVRGFKYGFSGPCVCPSTVPCGITSCTSPTICATTYGAGSMCVKTCTGGTNAGDPCINNTHCTGSGTCGAGFCRDRCGRCDP